MIHTRPSRRLGAALLVGIAGGVFLALAQTPWEKDELVAGSRTPAETTRTDSTSLNPRDFGVEPGALHDAVAAAPALRSDFIGPAPVMDAVPKASGVVIGGAPAPAKDAARAAAAGESAPMGEEKARAGKTGKGKAGEADASGGPDAKHKGRKGEKGGSSGEKSVGGARSRGAAVGRAAKNSEGGASRSKGNSRAAGSFLRGKGAAANHGETPGGKRRGSIRTTEGGAFGRAGRSGRTDAGSSSSGKRGRGRHGAAQASDGDDPFASGNSKVRVGRDGGGAGGVGKSRSGRKSGARGSKGGGKSKDADDGDDDNAAGGKGGGKKDKSGKGGKGGGGHGGGRKGGHGGGQNPREPKDPADHSRFHPILPSDGKPPIPPAKMATPPDFGGLDKSIPAKGPDGAPIIAEPAHYKDIEGIKPPTLPEGGAPGSFQWRDVDGKKLYCQGSVCGQVIDSHWVWMRNEDGKWWVRSYSPRPDGTMGSDSPAFVEHKGLWWWQSTEGLWYVVHDAEPWAQRYLSRFKQGGLVHPETGTQMVHTPDGNVMVVTPGQGAVVYDGKTGKIIKHIGEDELPSGKPKLPDVSLPIQ